MRVAITGASGSLGQSVINMLLVDDDIEKIVALDRRPMEKSHPKLEFRECDVREDNLADKLEGCDAVMHFAFVVEKSGGLERKEIDEINVGGTQNLFAAAAKAGINQVVYSSSIASYGVHEENEGVWIDESVPARGNEDFYYFQNKADVENWINKFEKRHKDMCIARLRPSIFLTDKNPDRPVGALALAPMMVSLRGVETRLHLTYETDVALAFVLALKKKAHGVFNVSTSDPLTLDEFSEAMGRFNLSLPKAVLKLHNLAWRMGLTSMDPVWLEYMIGQSVLINSDKIRKELGWEPQYPTAKEVVKVLSGNLNNAASPLLKAIFRTPMLVTKVLGRVPLPASRLEELTEVNGSVNLVFQGDGGGTWHIISEPGRIAVYEGTDPVARTTITMTVEDFRALLDGGMHLRMARMADSLHLEGDEDMLFIIAELISLFSEFRDAKGVFGIPARQATSWLLSR